MRELAVGSVMVLLLQPAFLRGIWLSQQNKERGEYDIQVQGCFTCMRSLRNIHCPAICLQYIEHVP